MGQDKSNVYLRETKSIYPPQFHKYVEGSGGDRIVSRPGLYSKTFIYGSGSYLAFCGKWFPFVKLHTWAYTQHDDPTKQKTCFSLEDMDKFMEKWSESQEEMDAYRLNMDTYRSNFKDMLERPPYKSVADIHAKYNCPVFTSAPIRYRTSGDVYARGELITLNPKLSDYGFVRFRDPYTAFQEIAMFLSSLATNEDKIPKIDDETMRDVKGFDKFSFRQDPKKPKPKHKKR